MRELWQRPGQPSDNNKHCTGCNINLPLPTRPGDISLPTLRNLLWQVCTLWRRVWSGTAVGQILWNQVQGSKLERKQLGQLYWKYGRAANDYKITDHLFYEFLIPRIGRVMIGYWPDVGQYNNKIWFYLIASKENSRQGTNLSAIGWQLDD